MDKGLRGADLKAHLNQLVDELWSEGLNSVGVSEEALRLVKRILSLDVKRRISLNEYGVDPKQIPTASSAGLVNLMMIETAVCDKERSIKLSIEMLELEKS